MPTFETISRYVAEGCLIKPLLVEFFTSDAAFRMTISTAKPLDREPDQWFHASAHPGLSERELVAYLMDPQPEKAGEFGYIGRMSVMFGTIWGEVIRQAMVQLKIMVPVREGICPACGYPQPQYCREHGALQAESRSRGHLDGIVYLDQGRQAHMDQEHVWGFEGKTIKNIVLKDAPDMDEEFFKTRWPRYWWQVQEYLRLTGLSRYIVLFSGLGNPWDLREYHVMPDPAAAYQIETGYLNAIAQARRQGWIPDDERAHP